VKPQSYEIGEKVLVYNPKKHRSKFAKWQVRWVGPFVVENKLNQANYVVRKGRGKPVVIHIDRLRKLPTEVNTDNADCPVRNTSPTSSPTKRRKADSAATATSTSCTDSDVSRPLTRPADNCCSRDFNVCMDTDSTDTGDVCPLVTAKVQTLRLLLQPWPLNLPPTRIGHALSPLVVQRVSGVVPRDFWKASRHVG